MKKYVEINNENIQFKNLLSGPAQVGRILNYIIFTGEHSLKHKPGSRNDNLDNNIGNAWCVEFMIGLGLIELGEKINGTNIYQLNLTNSGKEIYNILIENAIGPSLPQDSNPESVYNELQNNNALNIINVFEKVFRNSIIFKDLCIFLDVDSETNEQIIMKTDDFKESLFGELQKFYTGEDYIRNGSGASTAGNRVPSLIQLLQFLNYAEVKSGNIILNIIGFKNGIFNPDYKLDISDEHFAKEIEKEEQIINRLIKEFGISGNRLVTENVRLSQAQLIFKERLKREHGAKCWLCGLTNEQLLVASHIKDSAKCDIYGKTDNNNGLLLCPIHDKLFDLSLISFNFSTGEIMISKKINEHDRKLCNINSELVLPSELMTSERKQYLIWHNNEFYSEENN